MLLPPLAVVCALAVAPQQQGSIPLTRGAVAPAIQPVEITPQHRSVVFLRRPMISHLTVSSVDSGGLLPPPPQLSSRDTYVFEGIALGVAAGFLATFNGDGSILMALIGGGVGALIGSQMEKRSDELGPGVLQQLQERGGEADETLPPELQAVQTSLDSGLVLDAVTEATRYTAQHPDDPRGFLLLGDAYVADAKWDEAVSAYAEADLLDTDAPEPSYRIARLALLRGDEGLARTALTHVLEADPLHRDAWELWLLLYRDGDERQQMASTLATHAEDPAVKGLISQLLIEQEQYGEASRLLDAALTTDSTNPAWLALRAQSALGAGDTLVGTRYYQWALANAVRDTTQMLWRQVVGIASPAEIQDWQTGVAPEERGAWFRNFWARRNPDLFAGINLRVAEHFQRIRYARREYPLLHPLSLYHRSAEGRALNLEPSLGERQFHLQCEILEIPEQKLSSGFGGGDSAKPYYSPGPVDIRYKPIGGGGFWWMTPEEIDQVRRIIMLRAGLPPDAPAVALPGGAAMAQYFDPATFVPTGFDIRGADSTAARVGYNVVTGLSDRGVAYLRLGAPDGRHLGGDNALHPRCGTTELERWRYGLWGELRFARPSAFSDGERTVGEMIFRPMEEPQFEATQLALEYDATSIPAPLEFGVWTAQFRNAFDWAQTDVVVLSTLGELATSLIGETGGERQRHQSRSGFATIKDEPGHYVLMAHARASGLLGRQHLELDLRSFDSLPAMSDLLVSPPWSVGAVDRSTTLSHLRRNLVFAGGDTVRTYTELYGLWSDAGSVWYRVTYQLLRTGNITEDYAKDEWPDAQRFEFERLADATATEVNVETLDIVPQWIPEGRYLLRVEVEDLVAGVAAGRSTIVFEVRE